MMLAVFFTWPSVVESLNHSLSQPQRTSFSWPPSGRCKLSSRDKTCWPFRLRLWIHNTIWQIEPKLHPLRSLLATLLFQKNSDSKRRYFLLHYHVWKILLGSWTHRELWQPTRCSNFDIFSIEWWNWTFHIKPFPPRWGKERAALVNHVMKFAFILGMHAITRQDVCTCLQSDSQSKADGNCWVSTPEPTHQTEPTALTFR